MRKKETSKILTAISTCDLCIREIENDHDLSVNDRVNFVRLMLESEIIHKRILGMDEKEDLKRLEHLKQFKTK